MAIVKVAFDRDASFLGYFERFLEHCMLNAESDVVSIPELRGDVKREFSLELPHAVIKTLLRRQEQHGNVVVESNTCRIRQDRLKGADLGSDQAEAMRQQRALIDALVRYGQDQENHQDWDPDRAQKLLLEYVEEFSARLLDATLGAGELPEIDENWEQDMHVVHGFVLHAEREAPKSFEFLTTLVKGKMLVDAVYLGEPEIVGGVEPLADVEVFLDTPLLLLLLGHGGAERAAPYLELLEMLKRQEAVVRCFDANVAEAQRILEIAEQGARGVLGERIHGDIAAHLALTNAPADIALKSERLASDLLRLEIQPIPLPAADSRSVGIERALSKRLRREMPHYRERTLETDVRVLVSVHRLRGKASASSLPKCGAVMVTRNFGLYKISREFFQGRGAPSTIPTCIPMSAFTTMVWVREPLSAPNLPEDRVIAHALAAMNPEEGEWREVNRQASHIRKEGGGSEADAHRLRVRAESRQALRDDNDEGPEPYLEGDREQVRKRKEENARIDARQRKRRIEGAAAKFGRFVARLIFLPVIPLLCLGIIFGPLGVLAGGDSPIPGPVQIAGTVVFGVLSVASVVDGLSLGRRVEWTADHLEQVALKATRRFLG
ncbi:MAG TPA: hypothetical protein VF081_04785 [Solirubrobacterales bacterium]